MTTSRPKKGTSKPGPGNIFGPSGTGQQTRGEMVPDISAPISGPIGPKGS